MLRTLSIAMIGFLLLHSSSRAADELVWMPTKVDFGEVPVQCEVAQRIFLENKGVARWRLRGASSTCGCAKVAEGEEGRIAVDREVLESGDRVAVIVTAKPKRPGTMDGALFLKLETIDERDEPIHRSVGIEVRVQGVPSFELKSQKRALGRLEMKEPLKAQWNLEAMTGEEFSLLKVRACGLCQNLKLSLAPASTDSPAIAIEQSERARPGLFTQCALVDFDVKGQRRCARLELTGEFVSDLEWSPDPLVLTQGARSQLQLRSRSGQAFEIDPVNDGLLKVASQSSLAHTEHRLDLEWRGAERSSSRNAELEIRLKGHSELRAFVPVHLLVPMADTEARP